MLTLLCIIMTGNIVAVKHNDGKNTADFPKIRQIKLAAF